MNGSKIRHLFGGLLYCIWIKGYHLLKNTHHINSNMYICICVYIYTKNKYYTIIFYTYSISYPYKIIQRSIYDHMIYTYLYIYIHNISIIYFQSISIYKDDLNLFHPQISAAMHPLHGRIPNLESPAPGSAWVDLRNALRCATRCEGPVR